jgi:transcriptional regulator with XRE-family HTH domain
MKLFISHNISYLIRKKDWDHSTFAGKFDISSTVISNYIKGRSYPKIKNLVKMSIYFGCSLDDFILTNMEATDFSKDLNVSDQKNEIDKNYSDNIYNLQEIIKIQNKLILQYEQKLNIQ